MQAKSPFILKPLTIAISSLLATVAVNAYADEAKQTTQPEVIKVWATQINNDSSLLSDDIDAKQADHLSDLLRDQPGIDVGGSHSMVQSINIRGLDEAAA